nr:MAG TPA: hypothetical protein [Caudoviricetes sp.]DAX29977.1 MAG TPA: hypothetical protein [Caudoviricetes sp.]
MVLVPGTRHTCHIPSSLGFAGFFVVRFGISRYIRV